MTENYWVQCRWGAGGTFWTHRDKRNFDLDVKLFYLPALAPMYYRGSHAALVVYDLTSEQSFNSLKRWVKELQQYGPPNIVIAIAGTINCQVFHLEHINMF